MTHRFPLALLAAIIAFGSTAGFAGSSGFSSPSRSSTSSSSGARSAPTPSPARSSSYSAPAAPVKPSPAPSAAPSPSKSSSGFGSRPDYAAPAKAPVVAAPPKMATATKIVAGTALGVALSTVVANKAAADTYTAVTAKEVAATEASTSKLSTSTAAVAQPAPAVIKSTPTVAAVVAAPAPGVASNTAVDRGPEMLLLGYLSGQNSSRTAPVTSIGQRAVGPDYVPPAEAGMAVPMAVPAAETSSVQSIPWGALLGTCLVLGGLGFLLAQVFSARANSRSAASSPAGQQRKSNYTL